MTPVMGDFKQAINDAEENAGYLEADIDVIRPLVETAESAEERAGLAADQADERADMAEASLDATLSRWNNEYVVSALDTAKTALKDAQDAMLVVNDKRSQS